MHVFCATLFAFLALFYARVHVNREYIALGKMSFLQAIACAAVAVLCASERKSESERESESESERD